MTDKYKNDIIIYAVNIILFIFLLWAIFVQGFGSYIKLLSILGKRQAVRQGRLAFLFFCTNQRKIDILTIRKTRKADKGRGFIYGKEHEEHQGRV